jgi:N6-adenosine-specific RNA methylase IME4
MPQEALDVVKAWGFRLMNMKGFTWHKIHAKSGKDAMGMGHLTRGNSEDMLFAVKGKLLPRQSAAILQMVSCEDSHVVSARGDHSTKPVEFHDKLVALVGDVPRIELFARQRYPGWHHWGNECECDIDMIPPQIVIRPQAVIVSRPEDVDPDYDPDLDL